MSESRSLELRLESKIDSVDAAELIVMGLAREAGYAEDKIGQLGLAVRESMVNAVSHGNGYSQDKTIHFRVEASSEALTVGIRDEGEGFDPEQAPDPTAPENLLKTSGRGLLLMGALVDEFSLERAEPGGMQAKLVAHGPAAESTKEE